MTAIEAFSAARLSTCGCGETLRNAAFPCNEREMTELLTAKGYNEKLILGALSNTLVLTDYCGLAILTNNYRGLSVCGTRVKANAGERLTKVCAFCAENGLSGLENFCGIPGSVGGSIRGNAGAFGKEICESIASIELYDVKKERKMLLTPQEIAFSYRNTSLNDDYAVLSAEFELKKDSFENISKRLSEIKKSRAEKQPRGKSLGSVFKKANGVSAGEIIERAGLKGFVHAGVRVSEKHANFFINEGNCAARDYYETILIVEETVKERLGIKLEREVRIIGEDCSRYGI